MPFNPNEPQHGEIVDADFLRAQFNALKALDDAKLPAIEKGAANGVASLDANSRLVQPADWSTLANKPVPVADGTYTVGFGTVQNGTITVVSGIITAIQEASNTPADVMVTGGGNAEYNGGYLLGGTNDGKNYYTKDAHVIWWRNFAGGQWIMSPAVGNTADAVYYHAGAEADPWLFPWDVGNGPAPAPTVTEV